VPVSGSGFGVAVLGNKVYYTEIVVDPNLRVAISSIESRRLTAELEARTSRRCPARRFVALRTW
jgi:hypothetical protein